ncbi:hypothetical protein PVAND_009360 [Polypedilum vanderplanki]|uniref:long-chain-fatty-acid--CoA ligase n=1 Tax=Polypedilum vanderplanki TaxID=319348 RepID=A0A9J6CDU9_POLVA|nr:hypothetical protein PVAND_009360 [Polypedilum vanderplanki]
MKEIQSEKLKSTENRFAVLPSDHVKIFTSENEISPRDVQTIPEVFDQICEKFSNHNALMFKVKEFGTVAVLASNSVEWFLSYLAAIHAGGIITGIYTQNSPDACHHILESSKANIVVVDNDEQLQKILKIKDKLPNLKAIVQTFPSKISTDEKIYKWQELEMMEIDDEIVEIYQERLSKIKANACCNFIYTSGTTGNPKGVMLSHDNLIWTAHNFFDFCGNFKYAKEVIVSYLPLSHIVAVFIDISIAISLAATVYFADENALKGTLFKTLNEVRPTFFFSVPRVYEKIYENLSKRFNESSGIQSTLLSWARNAALNHHLNEVEGHLGKYIQYLLAKPFLNKIKAALGLDRVETLMIGSAPANKEIFEFFLSLDLKLIDAYGSSESTALITCNPPNGVKFGSTGKALFNTDLKIKDPNENGVGEICCRGRMTFMGYLNDIEKTMEVIDKDFWFNTGDVGYFDDEGFLFITGRTKELIVSSGGENIPYPLIENTVKNECEAISNAFLVGDKKKFLTMLITLKTKMDQNGTPTDELADESLTLMKDLGLNYVSLSEILNAGPDKKVLTAIQSAIDRANEKAISRAQKIQKFAILPNDFSLSTGELSSTLKLKRHFVLKKYKKIIDELYSRIRLNSLKK